MALVKCPHCRVRLKLDDEYLGHEVDCGACGATFVAEEAPQRPRDDDEEDRPRRRRRDEEEEDDDGGDRKALRRRLRRERREEREYARELVRPIAIALMVATALGVLFRIADLMFSVAIGAMPFQQGPGAANDPSVAIGAIIGAATTFLLSPLVIVACVQMMKLRAYKLAITACILSLTPCVGCCLLGIPIGIWGLIVLNRSDVRDAFS